MNDLPRQKVSNLSTALQSFRVSEPIGQHSDGGNSHQTRNYTDTQTLSNTMAARDAFPRTESIFGTETDVYDRLPSSGITLFSHPSAPNGFKIAIILQELGLKYHTINLDLQRHENRSPFYVSINPNGRLPAIIDHDNNNASVWESGAITLYLCRKVQNCPIYSDDIAVQAQIDSWVFLQATGLSPMIGQALHFRTYSTESVDSAVPRYIGEVRRVFSVVEMRLAEQRERLVYEMEEDEEAYVLGTTPISESKYFDEPVWLVGDCISIADLCFVPWNHVVERIGVNLSEDFPEVFKWTKQMMRRAAVRRALGAVP